MVHCLEVGSHVRIGTLLALGLLVAACGDNPPESQPGAASASAAAEQGSAVTGSYDACTLLTAEEVAAALGWQPVKTDRYGGADDMGTCAYTGPKGAAYGMDGSPPEQVKVGIGRCFTNFPCSELPDFANSAAMAKYRAELYPTEGPYADMDPTITPLDGLGVPAIDHDLATLRAIEMAIGGKKLAFVETWASAEITRTLAEKALARAR